MSTNTASENICDFRWWYKPWSIQMNGKGGNRTAQHLACICFCVLWHFATEFGHLFADNWIVLSSLREEFSWSGWRCFFFVTEHSAQSSAFYQYLFRERLKKPNILHRASRRIWSISVYTVSTFLHRSHLAFQPILPLIWIDHELSLCACPMG